MKQQKQELKRLPLQIFALLVLLTGSYTAKSQNWYPNNYWTFDGSNALTDSMGNSDLNPSYYQSTYAISPASSTTGVGKYLTLTNTAKLIVASSPLPADSGVTVEFLFRAGANINSPVQFFSRRDGAINLRLYFPYIRFTTKSIPTGSSTAVTDNLDIQLEAIGRGSYNYFVDNNWHHIVFKYDAKNGTKEVWVDGQLPAGFSKTLAKGSIPANASSPNSNICDINTITDYTKYVGDLDEIAAYKYALPSTMIYKHYTEFTQKKHYSFANSTVAAPAAASIVGSLNINEFAPGHPTPTVDALTQLKTFPAARALPSSTLFPNTMIFNPAHVAGDGTASYSTSTLVQRSKEVQKELVTNFYYALLVSSNTHSVADFGDTNTYDGAWIKMANLNPSWKTSANSYWEQLSPQGIGKASTEPYIKCECMPAASYLRNSSGQYIDRYGNVITTSKVVSPESALDSLKFDGQTMRYYLDQLTKKMTRPLNTLFENGEVITNWTSTGLQKDPTVLAAFNASGLGDWSKYSGRGMKRLTTAYTNEFLSLPALANTRFSHYYLNGHPQYSWNWSETRTINSLVNGQRYSSGDIYMQRPNIWRYWQGAAHGWQFIVDSRFTEISLGDKLFAPYVSPGWVDEELIPRPAQWLGFLKVIAMSGAEYFQTGYFVTKQPYQNPNNYVWQMALPGYAEAITTRYEDLMFNGSLMNGDVPADAASNPNQPGYSFYAGDVTKLVVGRKHNTLNKYALTGTIQPNSNMVGNAPLSGVASIKLNGQTLKFNIRRQGSTYIYDNTNTASPVFYQLDLWHEETHPYYWSKNFNLEGELFDNTTSTSAEIRTYVPAGTVSGDYTNFTSCVGFKSVGVVEYNFVPRGTAATQYVWVRARSKTGTNTGFTISLDGTTTNSITCVKDTNWTWYRYDATTSQAIAFANLSLVNHKLGITPLTTALEIDLVTIAPTSGAVYTTYAGPCTATTFTASITPASTTTFCQGGSVVLTATTGTSYLWSTGATTQSITVSTGGTYSATVTSGTQTATTAPISVTVNASPSTVVNASGATTFCPGGSVTLSSAATGATYLWSNGATTQSITATTSGNYSLTITSSSGCTATTTPVTVTALTAPTATITAGGATTFCSGKTVALTANSGSSYLWSNGATTQSINVGTSGSYIVTVTQSGGCSKASSATTVTVNASPSTTVNTSGATTFCTGGFVTLTSAATGATYLWSNGATSQAINVTTTGSYSATITGTNGCAINTTPIAVTAVTNPTATITASGATSFCSGGSVTLTANTGSTYLWSNGATTQSINVSSAGSYSVTVSQAAGCSKTSSATAVTVNPAPTNTVTASGPTTFCNSSVTLTSGSATGSYLWSNGATSKSITVSTTGNYTCKVTSTNGCTSLSTAIPVSASTGSTSTPTITASGTTSFCTGGSVVLTPTSGSSYLWSNGATSPTLTVTSSGSYSVTVTQAGGCSATSAATNVSVSPQATFNVTTSGPLSFCAGGSVTITVNSSNAQAYVWYKNNAVITSATSASYKATSAGTYKVRVQLGSCGTFANPYTVTIPCKEGEELPMATSFSAYPNPFNSDVNLAFTLGIADNVTIKIYDLSGKLIDILMDNAFVSEGETKVEYHASHLARGLYIAEIVTSTQKERIKISAIE
jgi:Secretion system C-terminal sorting domain